jgi:hypothetical protein
MLVEPAQREDRPFQQALPAAAQLEGRLWWERVRQNARISSPPTRVTSNRPVGPRSIRVCLPFL